MLGTGFVTNGTVHAAHDVDGALESRAGGRADAQLKLAGVDGGEQLGAERLPDQQQWREESTQSSGVSSSTAISWVAPFIESFIRRHSDASIV